MKVGKRRKRTGPYAKMQKVTASKLSSHPMGISVNPGETVTYTLQMENRKEQSVTVLIESVIDKNTVLMGGSDGCGRSLRRPPGASGGSYERQNPDAARGNADGS